MIQIDIHNEHFVMTTLYWRQLRYFFPRAGLRTSLSLLLPHLQHFVLFLISTAAKFFFFDSGSLCRRSRGILGRLPELRTLGPQPPPLFTACTSDKLFTAARFSWGSWPIDVNCCWEYSKFCAICIAFSSINCPPSLISFSRILAECVPKRRIVLWSFRFRHHRSCSLSLTDEDV